MGQKTLLALVGGGLIIIIALLGILFFVNPKKTPIVEAPTQNTTDQATTTSQTPPEPTKNPDPSVSPGQPAKIGYSLADVAKHASAQSCWTAINGNVYNLTTWIAQHPGGEEAILSICGKDGSSAFNDQHSGQRRPENTLATFKIGASTP